uniref:Uncharacterized protein n=1 Tax=Arundo donax TaxID=35708 RepID=A0A0A8YQZ8_ARUDO
MNSSTLRYLSHKIFFSLCK